MSLSAPRAVLPKGQMEEEDSARQTWSSDNLPVEPWGKTSEGAFTGRSDKISLLVCWEPETKERSLKLSGDGLTLEQQTKAGERL